MSASVLIDGHNLTLTGATGIGTYARNLAAAARTLGFEPELLLGGNSSVDKKDPQLSEIFLFDALTQKKPSLKIQAQRILTSLTGKPLGIRAEELTRVGAVEDLSAMSLRGFGRLHVATSLFEFGLSHFKRYGARAEVKLAKPPDLFHLTFPTPLRTRGCPNIYTIHDIVPLRLPQTTLDDKKVFLRIVRDLCQPRRPYRDSVRVLEAGHCPLLRTAGIRGSPTPIKASSCRLPSQIRATTRSADEIAKSFGLDFRGYYMFYGAIEPKKNVARLIDAYAASGSRFPLIVVGGLGWQYEAEIEKLKDERFIYYRQEADRIVPRRRVQRIPYLPFTQLMTLVKGARGVLFPSLYEGFGLPVLEAMTLGTPVITANAAALPEIAGDAAMLVDPTDVDTISKAIQAFDHDDGLRQDLTLRGVKRAAYFSPEAYQRRLADLYSGLGLRPPRAH